MYEAAALLVVFRDQENLIKQYIRHADHMALSIRKTLALTSLTRGGRSVGIVNSRTQAMELFPSIRKKLALTSLTSGGRSVGIVNSRTQAIEFFNIPVFVL
jgi:hypothetical protein